MNRPPPEPQAAATEQFLAALCAFVTRHGGACYRNWSPETLTDYFRFHLIHQTLAWCRPPATTDHGPRTTDGICGLAVAWQTHSTRLDAVCPTGRVVFDWTPTDPQGDCVWVADVVTTAPGAHLALLNCFAQRYPAWTQLPLWTYRRGQRHCLTASLGRLLTKLSTFNQQPSTLMQGGK